MIALAEAMGIAEVFAPDKMLTEEREDANIFRGKDDLTVIILKKTAGSYRNGGLNR